MANVLLSLTQRAFWERLPHALAVGAGALTMLVGVIAILGWHSGHPALCQGWGAGPPMAYNSALGMVVAGACLIATAFGFRRLACAAVLLLILGGVRLAEHAAGADFGVDHFFFDAEAVGSSAGRLARGTACCFALCGLALLALNTRPRGLPSLSLTGVAAGAVVTLAGVSVADHGSFVPGVVAEPFASMALLTALGFLIVALGVTAMVWRDARRAPISVLSWTPFPVAVSGCLLSLVLWDALAAQERSHLQRNSQDVTIIVQDELRIRLYDAAGAMTALSRSWGGANPRPKSRHDFAAEIGPHRNLTGLQSLARIESDDAMRWMTPQNDAPQILKDAAWDGNWRQYLESARKRGRGTYTFSFTFTDGQPGLAMVLPVGRKEGKTDYLVGLFRSQELFDRLLADSLPPGFAAAIIDGSIPLYSPPKETIPQDDRWRHDLRSESDGVVWDIHVWPTTAFLAMRQSALPNVALAAGCLISFLMGLALFCAGLARQRAGRAEEAQRDLVQEIEQRTRAQEALCDSERKLEEHLRQASKMEAVGRLAGGIAHDFNNLLTVISGYADIMSLDLGKHARFGEMLEQVQKATGRAATLTHQLLAFSRKQILKVEVLDLNTVVADLTKMLPRVLEEDIELIVRPTPGLSRVKCDRCQLEQAIINLAANARDAMPGGGKLYLELESVEVDESIGARFADVHSGPFVKLQVRDTGAGIEPAVLEHIFEPFFTTKDIGKGTGLGLAMVYGLVQQSGGFIEVESTLGQGAVFRLFLPACVVADEPAPEPDRTVGRLPGHETILVIEDEAGVRSMAQYVLAQQGYQVLAAESGLVAIRMSEQFAGEIDLLISDVVLPEISGPQAARALAQRRPNMQVLYISGHTNDAVLRRGISEQTAAFLAKPFSPRDLACKVRAILDAAKPAALATT